MPGADFTAIAQCPLCGAAARYCREFDLTSCRECGVLSATEAKFIGKTLRETELEGEALDLLRRGVPSRLVAEYVYRANATRMGEPLEDAAVDALLIRAAARSALPARGKSNHAGIRAAGVFA